MTGVPAPPPSAPAAPPTAAPRPAPSLGPTPAFSTDAPPPLARPRPQPPAIRVPPFADDAQAADMRAAIAAAEADPAHVGETAARLLDVAEARLGSYGIRTERVDLHEGYPALRVLGDDLTPLGRLAGYLDAEVDGFRLLYSPGKLLQEATRGAVWGFVRQVVAAHDMVLEGRLDPITRHEIEHALLNVSEEQGLMHRWLGFAQSLDGTALSEVDADVGGYVSYCSFQELPAYAVQVRLLGARLAEDPTSDRDREELEAMARWGRALSGRLGEVAAQAQAALAAHPEYAVFSLRQSTPQGRAAAAPRVAWASVDHDGVRVKFPLAQPGAVDAVADMLRAVHGTPDEWAATRAPLLAEIRRELTRRADDAARARAAFTEIEALAAGAGQDLGARRRAGRTAARLAV